MQVVQSQGVGLRRIVGGELFGESYFGGGFGQVEGVLGAGFGVLPDVVGRVSNGCDGKSQRASPPETTDSFVLITLAILRESQTIAMRTTDRVAEQAGMEDPLVVRTACKQASGTRFSSRTVKQGHQPI